MIIAFALAMFELVGYSAALVCNKAQEICTVASKDIGVGDRIGVYNADDELVAVGVVDQIRGKKRKLKIEKSYGMIQRDHRMALLASDADLSGAGAIKIYKPKSDIFAGASVGLAHLAVGGGSSGFEMSGFGVWRTWKDLELIGRANFLTISGEVSRTTDATGIETLPVDVSGFGLQGGVGYSWRHNRPFGLRTEFLLGGLSATAAVDGDSTLAEDADFDVRVKNGFGLYTRALAGAVWNLGSWHIEGAGSYGLMHSATLSTLTASVYLDFN